jgi:hypothetical protein
MKSNLWCSEDRKYTLSFRAGLTERIADAPKPDLNPSQTCFEPPTAAQAVDIRTLEAIKVVVR